MRTSCDQQSLSYPLRLPDEIQADALRLLDMGRSVINLTVTALWDRLDEFSTRTNTYAYKQVEEMMAPPLAHGHRQWRCEAEQAGRILRGQAERKHATFTCKTAVSRTPMRRCSRFLRSKQAFCPMQVTTGL